MTFQYRARHSYTALETQEQVLKTTVHINSILVGLFAIHLLSHAHIYSLYWGKFYVCACGLCSLSRFCSIHFIVILPGLKKIVRYTEDFVYKGSLNPGSTVIQVSKIQPVVYYQCCVLIGWSTTRLYVIAH